MVYSVRRQLGVHSLVDGRVFGTHDLGLDVSSADRTGVVQFDGLEILHLADVSPIPSCPVLGLTCLSTVYCCDLLWKEWRWIDHTRSGLPASAWISSQWDSPRSTHEYLQAG
jgi:hypothetical protein